MGHRAGLDRTAHQHARGDHLNAAPAPERWQEVKDVLAEALERDEDGRKELLDQVKSKDADLAREVESLLGWYQGPSARGTPPVGRRVRLAPGESLGPYEIQEMLDSGGMGIVYRARDTRLNRAVAVKVLDVNGPEGIETVRRFEREAKTVASLSHPNILSIFDYGQQGGIAYAVTELLVGENLRSLLRRGPLSVERAVALAGQIANGLGAAHEKGIVHRDLKPENIFLCEDGTAKILDFGLAKQTFPLKGLGSDEASLQTRAGLLLGTVGYMAPEQVRGQTVDERADVFAFGVVLHEMLSGRRPFDRETPAETLAAVLRDDLPSYDPARFPKPLADLLRRCMAKERDARFPSAVEIAPQLDAIARYRPGRDRGVIARRSALAVIVAGTFAAVRSAGPAAESKKRRVVDVTIPIGQQAYGITAAADSIWAANYGSNSITRIRARDGVVTGTFPVGEMPNCVAWDGASIWVANHKWLAGEYSALMKLDPADGRIIATYRLPGQPVHLLVDAPFLWVTETWPTYLLRKLRLEDGAEVGAFTAGGVPRQTVSDGESVWVTNGPIGSLTKIRASDGKILHALSIKGSPNFLRLSGDHVWVANNHADAQSEAVLKVKADDLTLVRQFPTPEMTVGEVTDRWFFTVGHGTLAQHRVSDGSVAGRWVVGVESVALLYAGGNLWTADFQDHSIRMITGRSLADADANSS